MFADMEMKVNRLERMNMKLERENKLMKKE